MIEQFLKVLHFAFWGLVVGGSAVTAVWICATLHEIHLDLKRLGDLLRDKQLEIPSPLMVERYENR